MPSRNSRNGRNKQQSSTHVYQQPTPSSRPSPDVFRPSSLPDDSASSSGEEVIGRLSPRSKQKGSNRDNGKQELNREGNPSSSDVPHLQTLVDITPEPEPERSVPPQSLPTPPLPESSDMLSLYQPQPELPLSPLWDGSGTSTRQLRSPILSSM
ncbi:hypothetical protein GYMLUDRAFT_247198 [Collybiopsis luxurians FD-317 M1]|uniref:Uncharacterized protein n=1 Tax=Collybiopsis luxurians FD-317 M1 TaxID=944289 RepID=A0A0D0CPI2_9AGAR|nr:hypothetical protein GYMLUDRAFT_247198 [Collybiopsis luxurians FD-317 M1]